MVHRIKYLYLQEKDAQSPEKEKGKTITLYAITHMRRGAIILLILNFKHQRKVGDQLHGPAALPPMLI
jgi:hypothetical protein